MKLPCNAVERKTVIDNPMLCKFRIALYFPTVPGREDMQLERFTTPGGFICNN